MIGSTIINLPNWSSTLIRLDKNLNVIWGKYYSYDIFFRDLYSDIDGTVICGDKTTGINLFKISPAGNILWSKRYDYGKEIQCRFINKTTSGDILIGGIIQNLTPYFVSGFLVKADSLGNDKWSRVYYPGVPELVNSLQVDNNKFAILSYNPFYFNYDTNLFLIDSMGQTLWAKCYKTNNSVGIISGIHTHNDQYIITTTGSSPYVGQNILSEYLIKTDSSGFSSCSDSTMLAMDSSFTPVEDVLSVSDTTANLFTQNINLTTSTNFSTYDICNLINKASTLAEIEFNVLIYPNPFRDVITINSEGAMPEKLILTLYNFSGACILKMDLTPGENKIDLSNFPKGIYHLKINGAKNQWSKNIVKI